MEYIPIKKSSQLVEGKETVTYIVPAMKINQGKDIRKIPHPHGNDRLVYFNEKDALAAVEKAGFVTSTSELNVIKENYNGLNNIISAVMLLLDDSNQSVVASAIYALGEMKAQESTTALISFLDHPNSAISQNTIEALAKIGAPSIPALIKSLKDQSWEKRISAAKCLGEIAQYRPVNLAQAINPLLILLSDGNPVVKSTVSLSLAKIYKILNVN